MKDYITSQERIPNEFTWKTLLKDVAGVVGFFSFAVLMFIILY